MFKEFFLRRRAFKVGQNLRQMHESSGSSVLTGQRVVNLAIDHWKDYCEAHHLQGIGQQESYAFLTRSANCWQMTTYEPSAYKRLPMVIRQTTRHIIGLMKA